MSIIKQLLEKMQGTIAVESLYSDTAEVCSEETGSTFTVTIPMQRSRNPQHIKDPPEERPSITNFGGDNERSVRGLCEAWEVFGCGVVIVQDFSDLSGS